jgi:hypothetical protein
VLFKATEAAAHHGSGAAVTNKDQYRRIRILASRVGFEKKGLDWAVALAWRTREGEREKKKRVGLFFFLLPRPGVTSGEINAESRTTRS